LNNYTNFSLCGDDEIIEKLIAFNQPKNLEIKKKRIFYKSNEIRIFNAHKLKIQNGSLNNLNELSVMLQEYYHEEYNGLNEKTIEEMQQLIISSIQAKKIFVLFDDSENLVSFCTIIDPDIGIMFTKRAHRKKGYGKIILAHCSKLILEKNETVYVMTDRDKIESNIVCEAVGFKPYYNHVMTKINCT
jgi:predicted GNAT family acetyltransferase